MRKLLFVIPLAIMVACGDKDEDTGDTGVDETEEEDTAGDE